MNVDILISALESHLTNAKDLSNKDAQQIITKLRSQEACLKAADELAEVASVYPITNPIYNKVQAYRNASKENP